MRSAWENMRPRPQDKRMTSRRHCRALQRLQYCGRKRCILTKAGWRSAPDGRDLDAVIHGDVRDVSRDGQGVCTVAAAARANRACHGWRSGESLPTPSIHSVVRESHIWTSALKEWQKRMPAGNVNPTGARAQPSRVRLNLTFPRNGTPVNHHGCIRPAAQQ